MQSVLRSAALISSAPSLVKAARTYTTASKFLHSRSLLCASSTSGSPRLEPKPFFPTEPAGQSFSSNGGSQASTPKHDKPSFASQNGHQSSENGATSQDMAHKKSDDFQGAMLDPSAANKNWVKIGLTSAAVVASAGSTAFLSTNLACFAHVLAYGLFLGSNVWVSVAGLIMFKNLPRQTFGKLQSKLFPPYFWFQAGALAVQMSVLAVAPAAQVPGKIWAAQGLALAATLINLFAVEPYTTKIMFQMHKLQNDKDRDTKELGALKKKFSPAHGISSTLNLVSLVAAGVHGFWLSSQLTFLV